MLFCLTKDTMSTTFLSLPFEILLNIAETGPGAFYCMRQISRSIKGYTDKYLDSYKDRWSIVESKKVRMYVTPIKMYLPLPERCNLYVYKQNSVQRITCEINLRTYQNSGHKVLTLVNPNEMFEIHYVDDIKHGKYTYSNKNRRVECHFEMGILQGSYKEWHKGYLYKSFNYRNNKLEGQCLQWEKLSFFGTTPLRYKCWYANGKLDGKFEEWYEGVLTKEIYFDQDMPQFCRITDFDVPCILISKSTYREGKLHGYIYSINSYQLDISGNFNERASKFVQKAKFINGKIHGIHSIVNIKTKENREYLYCNGVYVKTLKGEDRDQYQKWSFYKYQLEGDDLCPKIRQPKNVQHAFQRVVQEESCFTCSVIFNDSPKGTNFSHYETPILRFMRYNLADIFEQHSSRLLSLRELYRASRSSEWCAENFNEQIPRRTRKEIRGTIPRIIYEKAKILTPKCYNQAPVNYRKHRQIKQC